jgi:hypothetical protein
MPKVTGTKKQRAIELLRLLEEGPSFPSIDGPLSDPKAAAAAEELYRLWSRSWVLRDLRELVPELRALPRTSQAKA